VKVENNNKKTIQNKNFLKRMFLSGEIFCCLYCPNVWRYQTCYS